MLALERRRQISEMLQNRGSLATAQLAVKFNVTEITIRRDLAVLEKSGQLQRTHGGAIARSKIVTDLSQADRVLRQLPEKQAIAEAAVRLVQRDDTLLLDASSTVVEFAKKLPPDYNLTVVTYSQDVAEQVVNRSDIELILLGGEYNPRGRRYSGMITEMALRTLKIDRFFCSGGGLHLKFGVGDPNSNQSRLKRMMLEQAKWTAVLLDSSKLGLDCKYFFAKPDEINALVTDSGATSFFKQHVPAPSFRLYYGKINNAKPTC